MHGLALKWAVLFIYLKITSYKEQSILGGPGQVSSFYLFFICKHHRIFALAKLALCVTMLFAYNMYERGSSRNTVI